MYLKELLSKTIETIDNKRKSIITASLVILGIIMLVIVFFISSEEWSVSKEANIILNSIEERKYTIALENYSNWEKSFSNSKMKRLNKSISKKINNLLLDSGDKYINKQISKEHYIGIINTINSLEKLQIDLKKIIEQAKRVSEMYKDEVIDYDIGINYMNTVSVLNGIDDSVDIYKKDLTEINESRKIYNESLKNQEDSKYYEAIEGYNKVLQKDNKYYKSAQKNKEQCIENMYEYYIEESKELNKKGKYEDALKYIEYLKPYYGEDNKVIELEKIYQKNLSLYTMSADDIINLIVNKSQKKKENLSIESYQYMINDKSYYYAQVYEHEYLIDEILVEPKEKRIYSYKDKNKQYNNDYADGYFRMINYGKIQFAINDEKCKFIIENLLNENKEKYKSLDIISKDKIEKYIDENSELEKIIKDESNIYNYVLVNKGIFRRKEVFIINIYTSKVYKINKTGIDTY